MNLSQFHHDLTSGLSYILVYQILVLFLMTKIHVETFVNLNSVLFLTTAYCLPGPSAVTFQAFTVMHFGDVHSDHVSRNE